MKTFLKTLIALVLINNFSFGQNIPTKIDSIIKENYKNNPDVGISVGFIHNNKEYYTSYGKLSKESKTDIDKNTVFEIASITKVLTSNLIAQAVIENKIELDDYIEQHLPKEYKLKKSIRKRIKISDLASHQSGLTDIDFRELIKMNPQNPMKNVTKETYINIVNNCTQLSDYGKYRYSTIGYVLLGHILENIYGKTYDEIIQNKIINPLGMQNTLTKNCNVKNIVTGYNRNGEIQNLMLWNTGAAAGLVKSSAKDMVTYLKEILKGESKISSASLISEKIFYRAKEGPRKVGLGLNVYIDDANTYFLKTGDTLGQSSVFFYNRNDNWGIVILINQQNPKIRKSLRWNIYETVLK